jgi:hypothetical protein
VLAIAPDRVRRPMTRSPPRRWRGRAEPAPGGGHLTQIKPIAGAEGKTLTVGSKNFTEQFVLGEIYSQALEAAGFTVKRQLNLGSEIIANKALKAARSTRTPSTRAPR